MSVLVAAGAVSGVLAWHAFGVADAASNANTYKQLNLFGDVFDRVRADYVEQPDEAKMVEAAINGMLSSLDPHSSFMNAKQFEDMSVQTRGEFGGLGIEVTMENGVIKVVSPIDDTPASRAGIMANDLIIKIDGQDIQGLTLNEAVDKMRGKVGAPITVTVKRGDKDPFDQKLVRDRILSSRSSTMSRTAISVISASAPSPSRRRKAWKRPWPPSTRRSATR